MRVDDADASRLDSHSKSRSESGSLQRITNGKLLPSAEAPGRVEEAEDEASADVQTAFWDNLSQWSKDEQIILVENKEPTESARALGNYIHFFGNKSTEGRKGFFPSK